MTDRTIPTTITYEENCDYKASTITRDVTLPLQTVEVIATLSNPQYEDRIHESQYNDFYYNDKVDIIVSIVDNSKSVTTGSVDIYYIEDNSFDKTLSNNNKINNVPLLVNSEGKVYLKYQPHHSGTVIVKYYGEPYYQNNESDPISIQLKTIPVSVEFTSEQPNLTYIEDDVTLKAKVRDTYNNPVEYGILTFLSYQYHNIESANDGEEKVIGNPVMLDENGEGVIYYSPLQLFNKQKLSYYNTDLMTPEEINNAKVLTVTQDNYAQIKKQYVLPNDFANKTLPQKMYATTYDNDVNIVNKSIELIRAVYNYDNNLYGVKWKYYDSHSDWSNIAILLPGSLTAHAIKLVNDNDRIFAQPLSAKFDNFLHLQENEHCILKAKLLNIYGEEVDFSNSDDIKVTFHIDGTQVLINSDTSENFENNYSYIPYHTTIDGVFETQFYGETNVFIANITNNLLPGNYTIYASIDATTYNGGATLVDKIGFEADITNTEYFQAAQSEKFYITVDPQQLNNSKISITLQQNTVPSNIGINEKINKNTIKANITCPLVNESIFIGKKCYFFVTKQNKQYEATITYVNDKLEATLPTDISFEKVEDYVIYAYLPSGIYISNDKSVEIPTIYSNTKMISARYNLVPEITGIIETQLMYPGSVTFDVVVDNIFNENVPIKVQVKDSNANIIYSYTTNFTKANHTHTVTLTSLNAGKYTINATITDKNVTTFKTLTISKASLQQSNDALTNVVTNPHQKININISSLGKYINDGDLGTIYTYIKKDSSIISCPNTKQYINNICVVTVDAPIYSTGAYSIRAVYNGDDNFAVLNPAWDINFNAITINGVIDFDFDENDNLSISLGYDSLSLSASEEAENTITQHNGQYIIGELAFSNDNNQTLYIPIIFDDTGMVTVSNPLTSTYDWEQYYLAKITLNPTDSGLINAIKSSNAPATAIQNYYNNNSQHNYKSIQANNLNVAATKLKEQLNDSGDTVLFTTYGAQTIIGEINGLSSDKGI